jgi:hypothetical protein
MGYYYESQPPAPVAGLGSAAGCVTVPWVDANGASGQGELCGAGGDCGCAKCVQDALNRLGYGPITVTGMFGEETGAALLRFREANGIPTDAAYDAVTCQAIVAAYAQATGKTIGRNIRNVPRTALRTRTAVRATPMSPRDEPAPPPPPPPGPAPAEEGWWESQPTWMKATMIGSGVLLLGAVGYVALVPKKKALTPNRRHPRGRGARRLESMRRARRASRRRHGG